MEEATLEFSSLPSDIKLEVFKQAEVSSVGVAQRVCKEWYNLINTESVWKDLLQRDFNGWNYSQPESWRKLYSDFHIAGWQFNELEYDENQMASSDPTGLTAHLYDTEEMDESFTITTVQEYNAGHHYFEVRLDETSKTTNEYLDSLYSNLCIGVSNSEGSFEYSYNANGDVEDLGFGHRIRSGDLIGIEMDFDKNQLSFFNNRFLISHPYQFSHSDISSPLYIFIRTEFLDSNTKLKATINSRSLNFPPFEPSKFQKVQYFKTMGKFSYMEEKLEETIEYFSKAIEIQPDCKSVLKKRAVIYERLGKYQLCVDDYTSLIKLNPEKKNLYITRGCIFEIFANDMAKKVDGKPKKDQYLQKALEDYNQALKIDPNDSRSYNDRAIIVQQLGNTKLAIEDLTKAIELEPNNPLSYINRADLWHVDNNVEKAIEDYNKAISIDTTYAPAYNALGYLYKMLQKFDLAFENYNKAIEYDANDPEQYLNRAYVYEMWGKYDEAIADYAESIRLDPKYDTAYNNRADLYNYLGEFTKAIQDCNSTIALVDAEPNSFCHRSFAKCELGQYEEALKDSYHAEELDAKYARTYAFRGWIYYRMKDYEKAMEACERCLALTKDEIPDVYYVKGEIYRVLGNEELAKENFKKDLEIQLKPRVFSIAKVKQALEK